MDHQAHRTGSFIVAVTDTVAQSTRDRYGRSERSGGGRGAVRQGESGVSPPTWRTGPIGVTVTSFTAPASQARHRPGHPRASGAEASHEHRGPPTRTEPCALVATAAPYPQPRTAR